jgi:hypothetical protein
METIKPTSECKFPGARSIPLKLSGKLLLGLFLSLLCTPLLAQQQADEYEVKAVYLYNFATYTTWPNHIQTDNEPFIFAIAGAPGVASNLAALAEVRRIQNRPIEVHQLEEGGSAEGAHILFVGQQFPDQNALLAGASSMPILTVTEDVEKHPEGSAINFTLVEDKIRFDISLSVVQNSGLDVSSRLLSVARQVLVYFPFKTLDLRVVSGVGDRVVRENWPGGLSAHISGYALKPPRSCVSSCDEKCSITSSILAVEIGLIKCISKPDAVVF